jgi:hypothetical protein
MSKGHLRSLGQGEGPYYPVVEVANYDNDLANVGE